MNYDDLRIAIKRREQLKQRVETVDVESGYNQYCVHTYLEVSLPEAWVKMDEEAARIKYPNQYNPVEIFTEPGHTADFLIQMDESVSMIENDSVKLKNSMKDLIMRLQPANTFYRDGEEETEGLKICWFDFGSHGLDGMIYNLVFFTAVNGFLCTGSFHCQEQKAMDWKPIFLNALRSLKYLEVYDES